MKSLVFILMLCLSMDSFGQDTLVKKDGSIVPVKILDLDETVGLITYEFEGQTVVASIASLESYRLHSVLTHENDDVTTNSYREKLPSVLQANPKITTRYDYGPWSVSSNLTALFNFGALNSRMSIEPEYTVNDYFSIKTPITFGIFNNYTIGVNNAYPLTYYYYSNTTYSGVDNPPVPEDNMRRQAQHLVGQIGIQPKIYPFKKDDHLLSMYVSPSLILGVTDRYAVERYDRSDTVSYWSNSQTFIYWETNTDYELISHNEHFFFNYEFLVGLDVHMGKALGMSLEAGYASKIQGEPQKNDKVYTSYNGGPYQLVYDAKPKFTYGDRNRFRFRLLLTYRFGATSR